MHPVLVIFLTAFVFSAANFAIADDFGERFSAKAPAALGTYTGEGESVENIAASETTAEDLQNIMPAAGEEQENTPAESTGVRLTDENVEIPAK